MAKRKDERVIIHFDYDCFYASVFEAENPTLKSLPLAVQQKQIIVTCNYEARRCGLRKLQLLTDAKRICPEVVIVLGEDLTKFRDASKVLYKFIESFSWNQKVERLGFDEVFMDVTDIIDYNQALLNPNHLGNAFFQLVKDDPTQGFAFDASQVTGYTYPELPARPPIEAEDENLQIRLVLGSHLARHMRDRLEEEKGYTATVGISTTKLVAKLVGNLHKPKAQTTLLPPYIVPKKGSDRGRKESNVTSFIDGHEIGKIPGIGFKTAGFLRNHFLSRPAEFHDGLIYGGTKDNVTVGNLRLSPGMGLELLQKVLGDKPGAEKGIAGKIWGLINGIDDTEVKRARSVPSQISIEDSYVKLDTLPQVTTELRSLATNLIRRMRTDLVEEVPDDHDPDHHGMSTLAEGDRTNLRWIAHPKTLRLSTRPRPPPNADGTRPRSFHRISRSAPLPTFVFHLRDPIGVIADRLVTDALLPLFRKLHPEKGGWNLSLVNLCVANLSEMSGAGRDIGAMFRRQEDVLREWKVEDRDVPPENLAMPGAERGEEERVGGGADDGHSNDARALRSDVVQDAGELMTAEPSAGDDAVPAPPRHPTTLGSEDSLGCDADDDSDDDGFDEDMTWADAGGTCDICGIYLPAFAATAHTRFHAF